MKHSRTRRACSPLRNRRAGAGCVGLLALFCIGISCGKSADSSRGAANQGASEAYLADVRAMCQAPTRSGAQGASQSERFEQMFQWIRANLTTEEGRIFLDSLLAMVGPDRAKRLRAEGLNAGLASCDLADQWERNLPKLPARWRARVEDSPPESSN